MKSVFAVAVLAVAMVASAGSVAVGTADELAQALAAAAKDPSAPHGRPPEVALSSHRELARLCLLDTELSSTRQPRGG